MSGAVALILIAAVLFALDRIDEWRKRERRKEALLREIAEKEERRS